MVAGHTVHTVAPDTAENEPISQFVHALGPVAFLYRPAAHAEHTPPLIPVYPTSHVQFVGDRLELAALEFAGHAVQFGLPSPENVLIGHGAHALAPASEYAPAGQIVHALAALAPIAVEYAPAEHDTHALAPVPEYEPAEQVIHALAPASEYAPAGQIIHALELVAPIAVEYAPAEHDTHALAPVPEYAPAGQAAHTLEFVAPIAIEYVPDAQLLHWPLAQNLPVSHRLHCEDA